MQRKREVMKKWKRILCIAMAAMLSCPPVSVHAGEPEETYTLKMETDGTENVWKPERKCG